MSQSYMLHVITLDQTQHRWTQWQHSCKLVHNIITPKTPGIPNVLSKISIVHLKLCESALQHIQPMFRACAKCPFRPYMSTGSRELKERCAKLKVYTQLGWYRVQYKHKGKFPPLSATVWCSSHLESGRFPLVSRKGKAPHLQFVLLPGPLLTMVM